MSLKLEVVTPLGRKLEVMTEQVTAPGVVGEFGVLEGHRPGVVLLGGGLLRYDNGGVLAIRGGVAEISATGVIILADDAQVVDKGEAKRAEAIRLSAEAQLASAEYLSDAALQQALTDLRYASALVGGP